MLASAGSSSSRAARIAWRQHVPLVCLQHLTAQKDTPNQLHVGWRCTCNLHHGPSCSCPLPNRVQTLKSSERSWSSMLDRNLDLDDRGSVVRAALCHGNAARQAALRTVLPLECLQKAVCAGCIHISQDDRLVAYSAAALLLLLCRLGIRGAQAAGSIPDCSPVHNKSPRTWLAIEEHVMLEAAM